MFEKIDDFDTAPRFTKWLPGVLLLMILSTFPTEGIADVPPSPRREFREPERSVEDQQRITIAIYLLVALTVGCVALLIVIMLYGARMRRLARKPLPSTSPKDPLWYLKGKKPANGEPEAPSAVSQEKPDSENPSGNTE